MSDGAQREWVRAAAGVLRRSRRMPADAPDEDVERLLAHITEEGIVVPPLGVPGDGDAAGWARPVASERGWDVRTLVADPDAARAAAAALADLEGGGTSLWVCVGDGVTAVADLPSVLDGVLVDAAAVVVQGRGGVGDLTAARALGAILAERGVAAAPGTSLGADPIGRAARAAPGGAVGLHELPEIAELAGELRVRALVADGTAAHEAGAGDAGELGYLLACAATYLRGLSAAGVAVPDALGLLDCRLAVTDEQFVSIAKVRAARVVWRRMTALCGVDDAEPFLHAVTSRPMSTRYDPWVNLIRGTIAGFAAGVGGADAVTVLPFDTALGVPDGFGRRLARNVSAMLTGESHVDAVADPAGGSWAVEELTAAIAKAAWVEFQAIEAAGGVTDALADGSLRARWSATSAERRARIADRRRPLTGVTEFPDLREILPVRSGSADASVSWARDFEALRDAPAAAPVFLATLGPVADHLPRAGFVTNALAAGGIDVVAAGPTAGAADVVAAYRESGCAVACLTGSDAAYAGLGPEAAAGLRAAGAPTLLLAGRPPETLVELVDDHIAVGDDVLAFLHRTRAALAAAGATIESGSAP